VRPILFIHLSKTGGTSIDEALGISNEYTDGPTVQCAPVPVLARRGEKHDSAATTKTYYSDAEWQDAYKVVIVRNPWERLVSTWAMHTTAAFAAASGEFHQMWLRECGCSGFVANTTGYVANTTDPSFGDDAYVCPFTHFMHNCVVEVEREVNGINITEWSAKGGLDSIMTDFLTQLGQIENDVARSLQVEHLLPDHVLVDFIGRQENLVAHFNEALVAAGNNASVAAACAENLPHIDEGSAGHEEYTLYFQSEKTYKRSEQMLEMDATAFHYSFGLDGPFNAPLLGRGGSA